VCLTWLHLSNNIQRVHCLAPIMLLLLLLLCDVTCPAACCESHWCCTDHSTKQHMTAVQNQGLLACCNGFAVKHAHKKTTLR